MCSSLGLIARFCNATWGAFALEGVDLNVWLGEGLTSWFGRYLKVLLPDAVAVELLETAGAKTLPYRKAATFGVMAKQDDYTEDGRRIQMTNAPMKAGSISLAGPWEWQGLIRSHRGNPIGSLSRKPIKLCGKCGRGKSRD